MQNFDHLPPGTIREFLTQNGDQFPLIDNKQVARFFQLRPKCKTIELAATEVQELGGKICSKIGIPPVNIYHATSPLLYADTFYKCGIVILSGPINALSTEKLSWLIAHEISHGFQQKLEVLHKYTCSAITFLEHVERDIGLEEWIEIFSIFDDYLEPGIFFAPTHLLHKLNQLAAPDIPIPPSSKQDVLSRLRQSERIIHHISEHDADLSAIHLVDDPSAITVLADADRIEAAVKNPPRIDENFKACLEHRSRTHPSTKDRITVIEEALQNANWRSRVVFNRYAQMIEQGLIER